MKRQLVTLLLFLCTLNLHGQVNFDMLNGYIIKNNGDTLFGQIEQSPYDYLSTDVRFKASDGKVTRTYRPIDILGFYIEPDTYFERIEVEHILKNDTIFKKYFCHKVLEGELDFCIVYIPDNKERYFVRSNDFGIIELQQIIKVENGDKSTDNKYQKVLGKYMYKDIGYHDKIRNCRFNQKSLIKLISDYNSEFDDPVSNLPDNRLKWNISVFSGMEYDFDDRNNDGHNAWGFSAGILNSFYFSRNNLKTEFIIGLNYRQYQFKGEHREDVLVNLIPDPENPDEPIREYEEISYTYVAGYNRIELPVLIKYNNKHNKFSPIAEGGLRFYFWQEKIKIPEENIVERSEYDFFMETIIGLGGGLNYKRLHIKYLFYLLPLGLNTFTVEFRLK